jgi:hypothetical protein
MTMGDGPATDGTGNDSNLGDLVRTVVDDALGSADAALPVTVSGFAGSGAVDSPRRLRLGEDVL